MYSDAHLLPKRCVGCGDDPELGRALALDDEVAAWVCHQRVALGTLEEHALREVARYELGCDALRHLVA